MFLTESWFWRGTQSAIFYYISCSPYLEHKYKRQRRKEAEKACREKSDIVSEQPGRVVQPGPFETNPDWAEEIIMGPGPPKGWKKEKILQSYTESARERYRNETRVTPLPALSAVFDKPDDDMEGSSAVNTARNPPLITFTEPAATEVLQSRPPEGLSAAGGMSPVSATFTETSISSYSSDSPEQTKPRPSMERRLSSAVENIKGTIKGWNLMRYEREDEVLSGLTERLGRMWDKATQGVDAGTESKKAAFVYGRKRAGTTGTTGTNESERYDWQRAVQNPEINEMHPPTVSQLPATRDEAAWMLLPPPSAAVMAGRARPQQESPLRYPLAQIGRNPNEWEQIKVAREMERSKPSERRSRSSTRDSGKTPDLSNSSSDDGWTDDRDDNEDDTYYEHRKRHSAPVEGWMPVMPKAAAHALHRPIQVWERDEALRLQHVY